MRPAGVAVLAALLAASVSGCAGPGPTDPGSPSAAAVPALPIELRLNDCKGLTSVYVWPGGTAPAGAEVPPGWEHEDPARTDHRTKILECGRLSSGAFERGPIRLLFELHTKARVPPACLDAEPAASDLSVLRGLWFDDAEVAAAFASEWRMPVRVGAFTYEEDGAGGASVHRWTWGEPGGPVSELAYARTETVEGGVPDVRRVAWHDLGSVFLLDLAEDENRPVVTPYQASGWFRAPMMQAEAGTEAYVGLASLVDPGASFLGTFQRFGDLRCEQPLP